MKNLLVWACRWDPLPGRRGKKKRREKRAKCSKTGGGGRRKLAGRSNSNGYGSSVGSNTWGCHAGFIKKKTGAPMARAEPGRETVSGGTIGVKLHRERGGEIGLGQFFGGGGAWGPLGPAPARKCEQQGGIFAVMQNPLGAKRGAVLTGAAGPWVLGLAGGGII